MSISINEFSEEEIIVVIELKEIYNLGEKAEGLMFKKVNFNGALIAVNNALRFYQTPNIPETNNLTAASTFWVSRQLGPKKSKIDGKKKS